MNGFARIALLGAVGCVSACAVEEAPSDEVTWGGAEAHAQVRGLIGGNDLDLSADASKFVLTNVGYSGFDPEAATHDPSQVHLTRMSGVFSPFTINGEERQVAFSLEGFDPRGKAVDTELSIVDEPENDTVFTDNEIAFEVKITEPGVFSIADGFHAISGKVTLKLVEGENNENGFIPQGQGRAGFLADVAFSPTESAKISITLPFTENAGTGESEDDDGPPPGDDD